MKIDTNLLADQVLATLSLLHDRVYRNQAPTNAKAPYVVFMLESAVHNSPSLDYYLHVDVFDRPNTLVRDIEKIADKITAAFDCLVMRTGTMNAHLDLEQRQYISQTDLTVAQMINLRFDVRTYFFEEV